MMSLLLPLQIIAILAAGYAGQWLVGRALTRAGERYRLPPELVLPLRGSLRWLIVGTALLLVLERLGVSASILWTAISGFLAVAAVAFFAMWSVLSNLLCAVLILVVGPFRIGDRVEVMDTFDKPGARGRVVAINLIYTTLEEEREDGSSVLLQVPNSQFFQKIVRRWRASEPAVTTPTQEN